MHQIDPESEPTTTDDDSLYLYVNNNIEYGLFEDIVDSYYLDSQIKDDFQCNNDCYSQHRDLMIDGYSNTCTHDYHHITQSVQDLSDSTQQNNLHSIEENASSFADDTATLCDFSIIDHNSNTENANDTNVHFMPKHSSIHSQRKHAYRNTFGESNIQYHDFDNQDSLTFTDCKHLNTNYANNLKLVFSSSYVGCFCLVCWFSCSFMSEACACFGEWLREVLCVETFVRVLRSSRVNLK